MVLFPSLRSLGIELLPILAQDILWNSSDYCTEFHMFLPKENPPTGMNCGSHCELAFGFIFLSLVNSFGKSISKAKSEIAQI